MVNTNENPKFSDTTKKWLKYRGKIARATVIVLCIAGFGYQTLEFLLFYLTYPTVVDIQQTSPSYLKFPAFTICNPIGYNFTALCESDVGSAFCLNILSISLEEEETHHLFCEVYPEICYEDKLVADWLILYMKFLTHLDKLTQEKAAKIRMRLEAYMECTYEIAGTKHRCNLDNVLGSFYTKDSMPQFCYTIYSVWGDVEKQRSKIPKGAIMTFVFHLNASRRAQDPENLVIGVSNLPTSPYVQIAVHSPYFLPSPYLEGQSYHGGKNYEMRVTMNEKNLLPAPYQTNCTDYLAVWKENGGRGPVNQVQVIQECRMRRWYEEVGCVPVTIDYPHSHPICGTNITLDPNNRKNVADDQCNLLADTYNQPCHSISYVTTKEERDITITTLVKLNFVTEELRTTIPGYDCSGYNIWMPECSIINIQIMFDRFEITNLTYNAKYESLELFSVLGGYMGMWLGVSLVTIYDLVGAILGLLKTRASKKGRRKESPKRGEENPATNGWVQEAEMPTF